jgi:hypothetical protein
MIQKNNDEYSATEAKEIQKDKRGNYEDLPEATEGFT